jgi:lipopolysaccharide transport system ATP-binding protein
MRDDLAIHLKDVSKTYRLFGSQREQLLEVLGFHRIGLGRNKQFKEFSALTNLSLDVPKGARVGVVGRNGAGKTTLLKLICGNFAPTSGLVEVKGTVQALMGAGLGFHPEYTGRENARASLQYNGLGRAEYEDALEDILDFCELGDFIDQPFKTYSLGMQARLMFATATAIRPDILIVDEVLGAGDGYFIAKSRQRMERLVSGGCTMLLVSHSTQQILEMCQKAIWLEKGQVRMEGDAFTVVKAYEEHVLGANSVFVSAPVASAQPVAVSERSVTRTPVLQEPVFMPHEAEAVFPEVIAERRQSFPFVARGGLSRWESEGGVKICGLTLQRLGGETNRLISMEPAQVLMYLVGEVAGDYRCRYGFVINDHQGRCVSRIFSPPDRFSIQEGEVRQVAMALNPLQLGPGDYTLGISVLEYTPIEQINAARRFDLLGRSFEFRVEIPDSMATTECALYHSAEWTFG